LIIGHLENRKEYDNYIALFEDAGWKHVCGTRSSGNQYFLPMSEKAGTDIFSDRVSAAARYKTLYKLYACLHVACFTFLPVDYIALRPVADLSK
jgi:hypothetical protein